MRPFRVIVPLLCAAAVGVVGCSAHPSVHKVAVQTAAPNSAAASPATGKVATLPPTKPVAGTRPSTPAEPNWPTGPRSTKGTGQGLLVGIHTGRHATFDRVVFEFRDRRPGSSVQYLPYVVEDARGGVVPLRGQAFLSVVFQGASTIEQGLPTPSGYRETYTGPDVITPGFPSLEQVRVAGDFEGVLSFGIGLDRRVGFRVFTLTGPSRVVIDVAHRPAPAVFPGFWPFHSLTQARDEQRAVDQGHQPWMTNPEMVISSFLSRIGFTPRPVIRQVGPHTFTVTGEQDVLRVEMAQPVKHGSGGVWMITQVTRTK